MKTYRFPLGQTVATPGALQALTESGQDPFHFLERHALAIGVNWMSMIALKMNRQYSTALGSFLRTRFRLAFGFGLSPRPIGASRLCSSRQKVNNGQPWNEQLPAGVGSGLGRLNTGTVFGSGNTGPFIFSFTDMADPQTALRFAVLARAQHPSSRRRFFRFPASMEFLRQELQSHLSVDPGAVEDRLVFATQLQRELDGVGTAIGVLCADVAEDLTRDGAVPPLETIEEHRWPS